MRTRKKAIWVARQTTDFFTAPAGSAFFNVPAHEPSISPLKDGKTLLETNWATGRNFPTPFELGADGWSFDMEVPFAGLSLAAVAGVQPVAQDWLDYLLENIFGSVEDHDGRAITTALTTAISAWGTGSAWTVQSLLACYAAGLAIPGGNRTQWRYMTSSGGSVQPAFEIAPTGGTAYGTRLFQFDDNGGSPLAFVYRQDATDYLLTGGKIIGASVVGEMGKFNVLRLSIAGDAKAGIGAAGSVVASLPAVTAYNRTTKALLSPVYFNDAAIETRRYEIDFGITAAPLDSTAAPNGRAGWETMRGEPELMIEPIFSTAIEAYKRDRTVGRAVVQCGGGVLSGGILNTLAIGFGQGQVMEADPKDDQGRIRHALKIKCVDPVEFSTGVSARFFQLARA